jgi:hypothetical protein
MRRIFYIKKERMQESQFLASAYSLKTKDVSFK